jgi:hypothetical protein
MARKRDGASEGGADGILGIPIGDGPAMGMTAWRRTNGIPGLVNIQKAMENGDLTNKETVRLWWFYGDLMVILLSNRFGKW